MYNITVLRLLRLRPTKAATNNQVKSHIDAAATVITINGDLLFPSALQDLPQNIIGSYNQDSAKISRKWHRQINNIIQCLQK